MLLVDGEATIQVQGEIGVGLHQSVRILRQGLQWFVFPYGFLFWQFLRRRRRGIAVECGEHQTGCCQKTEARECCRSICRRHCRALLSASHISVYIKKLTIARKSPDQLSLVV